MRTIDARKHALKQPKDQDEQFEWDMSAILFVLLALGFVVLVAISLGWRL